MIERHLAMFLLQINFKSQTISFKTNITFWKLLTTHSRLRNYFASVDVPAAPQNINDLAPVIELYHHTVLAGKFDEAIELLAGRLIPDPLYYQFGAYEICIELSRALFANGEDKTP